MGKIDNAKLISVMCSYCGKKNHTTQNQLLQGTECTSCGMPINAIPGASQDGGNSFLHKAKCLNCGTDFDIPFVHSLKYLAECPSCKSLFLRKNLVFDELSSDKEAEAFKMLEVLYPTIPNNITGDITDATPASDKEIKLLSDLGIKAERPTSRAVKRLAKNIFDLINVTVSTCYNSILVFPDDIRNRVFLAVAKSPLLKDLYFERQVGRDRLEPIIREALGDDDVYRALCSPSLDIESFEIASVYILNFAKVIYDKQLSLQEARVLALKTFGRGYGQNIRKVGYFFYSHEEGRVKSVTQLSPPAMKSFYTTRNAVTVALNELFSELKYERPQSGGCLGLLLFLALIPALLVVKL